jgi:membrane protein DedA with SNARE-associated domain
MVHGQVNQWIAHYGAAGVFVAAAVEGELGVLAGGAMAHLGKLNLIAVLLAAWSAAVLSAQLFFHLGRSGRDTPRVQALTGKRSFALAIKWIDRHPTLFCLLYRFVYGMRIVGPVAISLSHIRARTFLLFNLGTALAWAGIGVGIGWQFGPELAHLVRAWFTPQRFLIASFVAAAVLVGVIGWRGRRAARRKVDTALMEG